MTHKEKTTMNKEILAVVAGEEITKAELDTYLQGVPREQQAYAANPAFREQFLDQLVSLYLFAKKGEENKLTETEEFQRVMANAKREILAQFAMRELLKDVSVEADEVQAFYDLNKAQFQKGESVCAKHILVDTEDECNEILAKVTNGVSYGYHASDLSASDTVEIKFVGNAGQTLTDLAVVCSNATYTVDADYIDYDD